MHLVSSNTLLAKRVARCIAGRGILLGVLVQTLLLASTARAQRTATPPSLDVNSAPVAPFADPDTTRNRNGTATVTRYTTMGQCVSAVFTALKELVREPGVDTLFGPASMLDRFPPSVRAIGERCRTQVSGTPIDAGNVQNVFTLATLLYDTVGDAAARERWFAAPQGLADRDETLTATKAKRIDSAIFNYVYGDLAAPMRKPYGARAHALFAQLEALGQPVRLQRLAMQEHILGAEIRWTVQETGRVRDPHQDIHDWLEWLAGVDSVGGTMEPGPGEYGANAVTPLAGIIQAQFLLDPKHVVPLVDSIVQGNPKLNANALGAFFRLWAHDVAGGIGSSVPPIHGAKWYNAAGDTVWPIAGQFSLLVDSALSLSEAAKLRRVTARYGPHGLRSLVVLKTLGYWDQNGTETGPRTAAQEMAQDSAFYLGYRKLPVMLTVEEAQFRQLPNGWWQQVAPVQYEREWGAPQGGGDRIRMIMVDSTGKLFAKIPLGDEAYMYALLDKMMGLDRHDATSPSPTPPSSQSALPRAPQTAK